MSKTQAPEGADDDRYNPRPFGWARWKPGAGADVVVGERKPDGDGWFSVHGRFGSDTAQMPTLPDPHWPRGYHGAVPSGGYTADQMHAYARAALAAPAPQAPAWQPIETAPKDGRTVLLGYANSHGRWRTLRGQWMSQEFIDENWEEPDSGEPGWYETSVENDDVPNCWPTRPTHWMPLPAAPQTKEPTHDR